MFMFLLKTLTGKTRFGRKSKEHDDDHDDEKIIAENSKATAATDTPTTTQPSLVTPTPSSATSPSSSEEHQNGDSKPRDDTKESRKQQLLEGQRLRESNAEELGLYAKNQRVKYHHRATNVFYDAIVVGVHFDDGPDKPYYTIKYKKLEDDGTESTQEKQTTPDRLQRVPWDEAASWALLSKK